MIKTRFAPSPTGALHVGGVRTALFSFLFAKANAGQFALRIEDTDVEREQAGAVEGILESMAWLGLTSDLPVCYQSDRHQRYTEVAQTLLEKGEAYRCVCSKERLETLRETQLAAKQKPRYDGHCRSLNLSEKDTPAVIRLKTPTTGAVSFTDQVYGTVTVSNTELDDFVLIRTDGIATYNFAAVVDDADMQMTHIIRGDDHLNNTPRQIHVYQAMGWTVPQFAHLPMILGPDGKKLSKRHGAVSVLEFQSDGYLPEALLNYLVRLGWSHKNQEIFSLSELMTCFDLAHVSRSPAIFDYEKLTWLNQHYLKTLPPAQLVAPFAEQLAAQGIVNEQNRPLEPIIEALAARSKTLKEMAEKSRCYLEEAIVIDEALMETFFSAETAVFPWLLTQFEKVTDWTASAVHALLVEASETHGCGMGKIAQPLRVALTGGTQSPPIDVTLALVGQAWTVQRLKHVLRT